MTRYLLHKGKAYPFMIIKQNDKSYRLMSYGGNIAGKAKKLEWALFFRGSEYFDKLSDVRLFIKQTNLFND
jgi:hypothetical protein